MAAGEKRRLEALHELGLLETPPEPRYDRITRLAAAATGTPFALICFIDAQRQWVKSWHGLNSTEAPREHSFCAHAIVHNEPLIVPDTRLDARFADNPLVVGEPYMRFYAGYSIRAPLGERVGALSVMDKRPRQLSPQELGALVDLTAIVEAELVSREAERRAHGLQQRMRESSHQAGMAEVATGVLHSVGNVVNSLGIANATIRRNLKALRLEQLEQAANLVSENRAMLASFLTNDERGRHLPDYLPALSAKICSDVGAVQAELDTTDALLGQLRDIVSAQRVRAKFGGLREPVNVKEVIDAALCAEAMDVPGIQVVRQYQDLPPLTTDRHKLTLILVNLLSNARDAVLASITRGGRILVQLGREADHAVIMVEDSGIGMSPDVLSRLWRFGFTTKPNGQGFDLHNSANAAREIGATLAAQSDGPNRGSRFVLRLPLFRNQDARLSGN